LEELMKALARLATLAAVATALAVPASAQIISTSLPTATAGAARDKFSAHIMVTPFAKWDYKEVYGWENEFAEGDLGLITGTPNSDFMAAAEMAFALGNSNWSVTIGGWYNKIGNKNFTFEGTYYTVLPNGDFDIVESEKATIPVDLTLYEGHLGIFYKAVGIQGGIVHTDQKSNGDFLGNVIGSNPPRDFPAYAPFNEKTNDYTAFGVVRMSRERWGVSAGAGAYFKKGITGSPLRFADNKVVFSGFVTGSVNVFKGLGVDASYWYIGKTKAVKEFTSAVVTSGAGSDAQSRFTVGLGYSF
jgi:hypothetical protein